MTEEAKVVVQVLSNLGGAGAAIAVLWWRLQKAQDDLKSELQAFKTAMHQEIMGLRERVVALETGVGIPRARMHDFTPTPVDPKPA